MMMTRGEDAEEPLIVVVQARTREACLPQQWARPRSESLLTRYLPRVVAWVVVCGFLVGAGVLLYQRDKLFDWHKMSGSGRKPFKTFKITPVRISCDALRNEDGDLADDGASLLETWEGGDLWQNYTTSVVRYTYGLAGLTEQELVENHCDYDALRLMFNPFKREDLRKAEACRDGRVGLAAGNGLACSAGYYAHVVNGAVAEARPAPDGYFSPEAFTCLVRCPKGGFCPASKPRKPDATEFKKCIYPGDVEKSAVAAKVLDESTGVETSLCPGSKNLYLCPGGYRCKWSEERRECERGYRCPRGSAKQRPCVGAGFAARPETVCPEKKTEFPDYTTPLAVFVACAGVVALGALAFAGTLAQVGRSASRAFSNAYEGWTTAGRRRYSSSVAEIRRSVREMRHSSRCLRIERAAHARILATVAGDPSAGDRRYAGYSATDVSRAAVYGGLCFLVGVASYPVAPIVMAFATVFGLVFTVIGLGGLCYLDVSRAVTKYTDDIRDAVDHGDADYDEIFPEGHVPVVRTACGCRRAANVVVLAVAILCVGASLPWVLRGSRAQFELSLVLVAASAVGVVALLAALALSVPFKWRPSRLCDRYGVLEVHVDPPEFRRRVKAGLLKYQQEFHDEEECSEDVASFSYSEEGGLDDSVEGEFLSQESLQRSPRGVVVEDDERKDGSDLAALVGGDIQNNPAAAARNGTTPPGAVRTSVPRQRRKSKPATELANQVDLRIDLEYKHLQVRLRTTGAVVLNNASGKLLSGNVTAVMGPSGAGKTTLMSALSDRASGYAHVSGERFVNGQAVRSIRHLEQFVSYVPQEDIMLAELTVRQTIHFYAAIRASWKITRTEVEARAVEALSLVELRPNLWDSKIGDAERRGISGGQKKRVSIAMELVNRPSLIFLDEPTSGLDSTTSFQVLHALGRMADTGANVIAVIHSPGYEIFKRFSHCLLLGVGGRCVFHDKPEKVLDYFTTPHPDDGPVFECPAYANPADFVMDVISGGKEPVRGTLLNSREDAAEQLGALWKARSSGPWARYGATRPHSMRTLVAYASRPKSADDLRTVRRPRRFYGQLVLFARRGFLQLAQRPTQLIFDACLMFLFGALFGYQSEKVTLARLPLAILWLGIGMQLFLAVAMLRVFSSERVVFWREAAGGSGMALDVNAYFWAKDLVQIPRLALLVLSFTSVFYALARPSPSFAFYFLTLFLTGYAVSGYAYVLSIALEPNAAQLFAVVTALVLTLMSGIGATTLPKLHEMPGLRLIPWISPVRWAGETLFVAETRRLSHAWKLSPTLYALPQRDSALASLFTFAFHEGWLYVKDGGIKIEYEGLIPGSGDEEVCRVSGRWTWSDPWNFAVLFTLGLLARLLALLLLRSLHREKMGEPPLTARVAAGLRGLRDSPARFFQRLSSLSRPRSSSLGSYQDDDGTAEADSFQGSHLPKVEPLAEPVLQQPTFSHGIDTTAQQEEKHTEAKPVVSNASVGPTAPYRPLSVSFHESVPLAANSTAATTLSPHSLSGSGIFPPDVTTED